MIKGNSVIIKNFETLDEVKEYVELYNDLSERSLLDHTETASLKRYIEIFEENKFATEKKTNYMILNEENKLVGMFSFKKESDFELTLGYRILKQEYMNKGYMLDALKTYVDYVFKELPLISRLSLYIHSENIPSIRLAEKCQFIKEGTMRKSYKYRNKLVDFHIYALLKEEYNQ